MTVMRNGLKKCWHFLCFFFCCFDFDISGWKSKRARARLLDKITTFDTYWIYLYSYRTYKCVCVCVWHICLCMLDLWHGMVWLVILYVHIMCWKNILYAFRIFFVFIYSCIFFFFFVSSRRLKGLTVTKIQRNKKKEMAIRT